VSVGERSRGAASEEDGQGGEIHAQVLVLGGGPGGYTAAFRAADLGLEVVLVERHETLGGVCLNVGCIPSKALLHVAKVIADAERAAAHGVSFGPPRIELGQLRDWKRETVEKLTGGLAGMAKLRRVRVLRGDGRLTGQHTLAVGETTVSFDHAILATGSRAIRLPGIPYEDPRVMDSTDALELEEIPERLLVIGGGIIGLELASVYDALGSRITVVEIAEQLMVGCDPDLVEPLRRRLEGRYAGIHLRTRVTSIEAVEGGLRASFAGADGGADEGDGDGDGDGEDASAPGDSSAPSAPQAQVFDRVLVAVGRAPNSQSLGLEHVGVAVDGRGFVAVDSQQRTSTPHIHAIGDLVGPPMLAHKATHEGKVAAEVIAGEDVELDVRGIPSVAYTDPEIAWVGLTETAAKLAGVPYTRSVFPWSASGRALASAATEGMTKLIVDPDTNRILGAGIVGANAGELIAEPGLALELGADTQDVALTVHAHPTLSETVALAAEVAEGTITDLPPARRR
jgi:dihydrolipoamide dehydrogenase